jgi:hypothetical protein
MLLTACTNSQQIRDEDSQFFSVPLRSTFTLHTEITIPPDNTSVYFQFAKVVPVSNIDFYKPHCKFELYSISEQARQVRPDTFVVTRIVDQREDVSVKWPRYAGLGLARVDGPVHLTFSTTMYLDSGLQPDVFRMNCKRWDWPAIGEFLSINEMRQTLGDYFSLTLAE